MKSQITQGWSLVTLLFVACANNHDEPADSPAEVRETPMDSSAGNGSSVVEQSDDIAQPDVDDVDAGSFGGAALTGEGGAPQSEPACEFDLREPTCTVCQDEVVEVRILARDGQCAELYDYATVCLSIDPSTTIAFGTYFRDDLEIAFQDGDRMPGDGHIVGPSPCTFPSGELSTGLPEYCECHLIRPVPGQ